MLQIEEWQAETMHCTMMSAAAVAWPFQPAPPFWPDWAAVRQSDITLGRESVAPFLRSRTWSAHALLAVATRLSHPFSSHPSSFTESSEFEMK